MHCSVHGENIVVFCAFAIPHEPAANPPSILTFSLTHSLTHALTHSLTHSLSHSLTHSLTRSLTLSLTHSPRLPDSQTPSLASRSKRVLQLSLRYMITARIQIGDIDSYMKFSKEPATSSASPELLGSRGTLTARISS